MDSRALSSYMKSFFEAKIWPLKNKLYRMALLWLKDRDNALDAVQEALTKGFVYRERLSKMANPTGWMVRTLKNEVYQKIREERRWEKLEDHEPPPMEAPVPQETTETTQRVFLFLDKLPDKQKEVFYLREVEGLTYLEIAAYLEISEKQVKISLHRARKKLKNYLINHARTIG